MQQLIANKWFAPLLAMFVVVGVSSLRIYMYIDGAMSAYAKSFYVDTTDYFVYWTFHTQELQQMIDSLDAKKKELDKREESMHGLETRLESEKKELADIKTQLESMRGEMSNTIVESKDDELKNLKSLATTYSNMNAEAVVGILNNTDDNTVVKILALMKSDVVGPIFEAMVKLPGQEGQMRARIARLSEKIRLYKQTQAAAAPAQ